MTLTLTDHMAAAGMPGQSLLNTFTLQLHFETTDGAKMIVLAST